MKFAKEKIEKIVAAIKKTVPTETCEAHNYVRYSGEVNGKWFVVFDYPTNQDHLEMGWDLLYRGTSVAKMEGGTMKINFSDVELEALLNRDLLIQKREAMKERIKELELQIREINDALKI